jgi:uncharacterized repeat protein (TIGR03803 family)
MPRTNSCIAASCILALTGLLPVFSSGSSRAAKEKILYSFTGGTDGATPMSDLTLDSAGNLYGTTYSGGTLTACNGHGCGTVFEIMRTQGGSLERVLYSFAGGKDGGLPKAGVTFDGAGNLYGITTGGGAYNEGTVFKLTPGSNGNWKESVIYNYAFHSFGIFPAADLAVDTHGDLYGTSPDGGLRCNASVNCGVVFELIPRADGSWTENTLHEFSAPPPDGAIANSSLVLDSAGNVYGSTPYGGNTNFLPGRGCYSFAGGFLVGGCGTVYELTPQSDGDWTETVLYAFSRGGGYGHFPSGGLLLDRAGHILGTTDGGGDGSGVAFELKLSEEKGWQQNVLHIFYPGDPGDGFDPVGRLISDTTGNLYGVTIGGGKNGYGTVFELQPSRFGWVEKHLYNFSSTDAPKAGLVRDPQGHLYGTTSRGGAGVCEGGCGTVYEITQ